MSTTDYIDVHTHQHRKEVGITGIFNLFASQLLDYSFIEGQLYSAGIHPWHISEDTINEEIEWLEKAILNKQISAIGETGLDKVCTTAFELQRKVFREHLKLADKYDLPIIIHCVRAYNEVLEELENHNLNNKVIFHSFQSSYEMAQQLLNKGYALSFGAGLLNNIKIAEVFRKLSTDSYIFLETDDSSISIEEIYNKAALLWGIKAEELKAKLEKNFRALIVNKA